VWFWDEGDSEFLEKPLICSGCWLCAVLSVDAFLNHWIRCLCWKAVVVRIVRFVWSFVVVLRFLVVSAFWRIGFLERASEPKAHEELLLILYSKRG
jgi:hypothetical protein